MPAWAPKNSRTDVRCAVAMARRVLASRPFQVFDCLRSTDFRFFDVAFSAADISGWIVFGVVIDVSICDFVNMQIHRRAMSCDAAEARGHVIGCSFAVVSVASCGRDDRHHVIRRCEYMLLGAVFTCY